MDGLSKKNADLPARVVSAVVMAAVAGLALWQGGVVWTVFVALVGLGVLVEWARLVGGFVRNPLTIGLWLVGGMAYVGLACFTLVVLRGPFFGAMPVLTVLATVIAIDVGAYFTGRQFGGPKIAPRISPSKTWSGLGGGVIGAALVLFFAFGQDWRWALAGIPAAVVAQTGDFFESWMKRRAGVKDSGRVIPGHGGLFDRVDGLLAVLFVVGVVMAVSAMGTR